MSEEEVRALFSTIGSLQTCKVIKDKFTCHSLGYAFVNYISAVDAETAIKTLNGTQLQNKTIKVSYARPSGTNIMNANLYIACLPKTFTAAELEAMFQHYGKIINSKILLDQDSGMSRGVGFIRYDKHSEAESAITAMNGKHLPGSSHPLLVKFANQAKPTPTMNAMQAQNGLATVARKVNSVFNSSGAGGPMRHAMGTNIRYNPVSITPALSAINPVTVAPAATPVSSTGTYCLFVYNIPDTCDDGLLIQLFGNYGMIANVKVIRDPEGKCKGYGFVNMVTYESAYHAVCALNGYVVEGKQLQVSFKKNNH